MKSSCSRLTTVGIWFAAMAVCGAAAAQTTPQIEYLFPAGAQRGTRTEVAWGGKFIPGPVVWNVAGGGIIAERATADDRIALILSADAAPGPREVRVSVAQGGSAPVPFLVGDLPEIIRQADARLTEIELPVTINGQLGTAGEIHRYSLALAAGQQVVAAAVTRAIRSPVDATLRLIDAEGAIVARSEVHRTADALLTFRTPQAGRYTLEIFDFQLAGGPRSIYRLTVTAGPWIAYAFPAGVPENTASEVTLHGWNLPGENERVLKHRVDPLAAGVHSISIPGCANRFELTVSRVAESLETEPNDTQQQGTPIAAPVIVNGRFNRPSDVDLYQFSGVKGVPLVIAVASASLRFPADPMLAVSDEAGTKLVEMDDAPASRDPRLQFTPSADGKYFVAIRERARQGGDEFIYRLSVGPLSPDVSARVDAPSFALESGQSASLPVQVERLDGFDDELEVTAIDLPAGITVAPQTAPKGARVTVQLPFTAASGLAPAASPARIIVRQPGGDPAWQRVAMIAENAQADSGSQDLWLAIRPAIPFKLEHTATILDAPRLAAFPFPIRAQRKADFTKPIRLVGVEPDVRGTVVPLTGLIGEGSSEGTLPLILQQQVTEGTTHRCRVMGVAEVPGADGKPYTVFQVADGSMLLGCQPGYLAIAVEPQIVIAERGKSIPIRVRLERRVEMEPIELRVVIPTDCTGIASEPVVAGKDELETTIMLKIATDGSLPPRGSLLIEAKSLRQGLPVYARSSVRVEVP